MTATNMEDFTDFDIKNDEIELELALPVDPLILFSKYKRTLPLIQQAQCVEMCIDFKIVGNGRLGLFASGITFQGFLTNLKPICLGFEFPEIIDLSRKSVDVEYILVTLSGGNSIEFTGNAIVLDEFMEAYTLKTKKNDCNEKNHPKPLSTSSTIVDLAAVEHQSNNSLLIESITSNESTLDNVEYKEYERKKKDAMDLKLKMIHEAEVMYLETIMQLDLKYKNAESTCTLCYDQPVTITLIPCMHKVCNSCFEKINLCPWDRSPIQITAKTDIRSVTIFNQ